MKKIFFAICMLLGGSGQAQLPRPNHIVILMFQNKAYSQIVGSPSAPYINSLLADTNCAQLSQYFAMTHPSQPNYLFLYSASNQGVQSDDIPQNTPFTTCNLGASLINRGFSFKGYSESMPYEGYLGTSTNLYFRKHNPWSDWQGNGSNQIPASSNQPFSSFPSDFHLLPTVSIVVPNIINCMHDGTIQQGDTWFKNNLDAYVQWTKRNNSLLIVTFDEDNNAENNHILTFFYGPMVNHGNYVNRETHLDLLRTIEEMYGLDLCNRGAASNPIDFIWKMNDPLAVAENTAESGCRLWPNPVNESIHVRTGSQGNFRVSIHDALGRRVKEKEFETAEFSMDVSDLCRGVYSLSVYGSKLRYNAKFLVN